MSKYLRGSWSLVATRPLFKTSNRYIGLGPRRTDKRGIVVIFDCVETPFVLHPTGDFVSTKDDDGVQVEVPVCRLVAECFLHG
jgi:hypothetical protein